VKRFILDNNGAVVSVISGTADMVILNTPKNANYIEGDYEASVSDYWNGVGFSMIGAAPNDHSVFDYVMRSWIDLSTLQDKKIEAWHRIKNERDKLEFGGFEFEGNIYDSDQVSQGRIMGAAAAGVDRTWTLADNTTVELSASQLRQLYVALQVHIASVHERGRIARQLIFDAETKEQVELVQL